MKDLGTETEDARLKVNNFFDRNLDVGSSSHSSTTMPSNNQGGVTGAVTTVTGTLGAAVGGVSRTVGGVVGATGRGVGGTINNTTGTTAVGNGLQALTNTLEDATNNVAHGVEKGSVGKKVW
ncbi:hypothetical protein LTR91_017377 [Friedmanniomyces endolithicus]|uniref:Uncharacterized protein n=1 Tax=Friedmanniomyces endolithicus TaxID=329885 RepID=A0AAN6FVP7_9PEZI|nr:hypothetical protein LTS09_016606 [Friedmanniomyces endolithicus]KAK0287663.1 hypothetical protein LTR35_004139 [Friedmanniomyces endolithicus]KAK0300041.1 hypothetical protein LTS00_001112 [Friedmanniomyces endolithicus]KAK0305746.1 hypothetical protein LTR01_006530 [Friedmanniomyces endolithicus]KAK0325155.1 hypothetical protein LTR82_004142 [Friedmanniomyces endolithicus]